MKLSPIIFSTVWQISQGITEGRSFPPFSVMKQTVLRLPVFTALVTLPAGLRTANCWPRLAAGSLAGSWPPSPVLSTGHCTGPGAARPWLPGQWNWYPPANFNFSGQQLATGCKLSRGSDTLSGTESFLQRRRSRKARKLRVPRDSQAGGRLLASAGEAVRHRHRDLMCFKKGHEIGSPQWAFCITG